MPCIRRQTRYDLVSHHHRLPLSEQFFKHKMIHTSQTHANRSPAKKNESVFNWNTPNAVPLSHIQHLQSLYRIYMPFQNPQSTVSVLPYSLPNPKVQSRTSHPIPVYSVSPLPINSPYSPQFSSHIQTLPSIPSSQTQTSILSESNHFSFPQRLNRSIS